MAEYEYNSMDDYQAFTGESARYPQDMERAVNYCILGMTGEAGEVAEKWKKVIRDEKGILTAERRAEMMFELGDVLWYVARLADHLGYNLSSVAKANQLKLESRMERDKIQGSGDTR